MTEEETFNKLKYSITYVNMDRVLWGPGKYYFDKQSLQFAELDDGRIISLDERGQMIVKFKDKKLRRKRKGLIK